MTAPATAVAAAGTDPDMLVLHGQVLRAGVAPEATSRFGDDTWDLTPALHQAHQRTLALHFTTIPAAYRQAAKEICYALLSGPLPTQERRLAPETVRGVFSQVKAFFTWLDQRPPPPGRPARPRLAELTGADLADYDQHLRRTLATRSRARATHRAAVRYFWRYRTSLPGDRLGFDPVHVDGWSEPRHQGRENATERIPEPVLGPLVVWALRFVDDFAPDILAAAERRRASRGGEGPPRRGPDLDGAVEQALGWYVEHGRPLPGWRGGIDLQILASAAGCHRKSLGRRFRGRLAEVAAVVGVSQQPLLPVLVHGRLDGQPWLDGIASGSGHSGLATLARMLHAATYLLIGYLSGMRDGEIKHLRRGCLHTERAPGGAAYRWKVASLAFKGETDRSGVPATWVVGEPAARAVGVLEALQPPQTELLFVKGH